VLRLCVLTFCCGLRLVRDHPHFALDTSRVLIAARLPHVSAFALHSFHVAALPVFFSFSTVPGTPFCVRLSRHKFCFAFVFFPFTFLPFYRCCSRYLTLSFLFGALVRFVHCYSAFAFSWTHSLRTFFRSSFVCWLRVRLALSVVLFLPRFPHPRLLFTLVLFQFAFVCLRVVADFGVVPDLRHFRRVTFPFYVYIYTRSLHIHLFVRLFILLSLWFVFTLYVAFTFDFRFTLFRYRFVPTFSFVYRFTFAFAFSV